MHTSPREAYRATDHETDAASVKREPQEIAQALTVFDVTPETAAQPDVERLFAPEEQEVVEGVRGTLEEYLISALDNGKKVAVEDMFNWFDAVLKSVPDTVADPQTLAELSSVAQRMRDTMVPPSPEAIKERQQAQERAERQQKGRDLRASVNGMIRNRRAGMTAAAESTYNDSVENLSTSNEWMNNPAFNVRKDEHKYEYDPNHATPLVNKNETISPDRVAEDLIYKATNGRSLSDMNDKEVGKLRRQMAKELHPDVGGDTEVHQAANQILDAAKAAAKVSHAHPDNYDTAA